MNTSKGFMGRCCTDRFYLDNCDCEKDKTMRVGDRVIINGNCTFSETWRRTFDLQIGIVERHAGMGEVVVRFPIDLFGISGWLVSENELDVIECINNEETCFDENCRRCMSIAYDPTAGD